MSRPRFLIGEWADRKPVLRWPLVFICMLLLWGLGGAIDNL